MPPPCDAATFLATTLLVSCSCSAHDFQEGTHPSTLFPAKGPISETTFRFALLACPRFPVLAPVLQDSFQDLVSHLFIPNIEIVPFRRFF